MTDIYKAAYNQLVDILDKDYQRLTNLGINDPYDVSVSVDQLNVIKNMVKAIEDSEGND